MGKFFSLVSVVTVLSFILAACSAAPESDSGHAETQPSYSPNALDPLGIPASPPIVGPDPGEMKRIRLASGREYLVNVPESYDGRQKWPLVLAFHGWKETANFIYEYTELSSAEAITVFPEGKKQAWAPAPYAESTGAEDIEFVSNIVDSIRATYNVDDERIFATGMSNGGGFAAFLGCQMPEVFNSVATVSAAYYDSIQEQCQDQPVGRLDMHGTEDPIVDYDGGTRHGTPYNSVPEVLDQDQIRNRCESNVNTALLANNAFLMSWQGCEAPLQHIRIGGGEHVWPGGTYDSDAAIGTGFATDKVLDFFQIPGRPEGTVETDPA